MESQSLPPRDIGTGVWGNGHILDHFSKVFFLKVGVIGSKGGGVQLCQFAVCWLYLVYQAIFPDHGNQGAGCR